MTVVEIFIAKANEKYNNKYDYSKFDYNGYRNKSVIICPIHGEFLQSPRQHLRGNHGCNECYHVAALDEIKNRFIEAANKRYDCWFDYSEFCYVDAKTKSTIICPKHGEFEQTPDKHLQGTNPCPSCEAERKKQRGQEFKNNADFKEKISKTNRKGVDEFIGRAHEKFGNKFEYDLTYYTGMVGNKIKIKCPKHGWFEKVPRTFLLSGFGCTQCGFEHRNETKSKSYESFVEEANIVHSERYSYPESNKEHYVNRNSVVEIECEKHGIFTKRAQKHLAGQGCFKCKIDELVEDGVLVGGYNDDVFAKNQEIANKKGCLYYLSINDGEYYKIGITSNLRRRLNSLNSLFGKVELVKSQECRLEDAYHVEQRVLNTFKNFRVYTKKSTELFSCDISNEQKFKQLFNLLSDSNFHKNAS